ncbi:MAG: PDC sensor domain-containing protein [Gammaproteobacteria bacterium]
MTFMNYINVIERYHEHRAGVQDMVASILTGIAESRLMEDPVAQHKAMQSLAKLYRFVDLLYILDESGMQISDSITSPYWKHGIEDGKRKDRSQRPYFILARANSQITVTDPYLSNASRTLCITAVIKIFDSHTRTIGYLVLDVDLAKAIAFLMGDSSRSRFQPLFKFIYVLIVIGLFSVVAVLLYSAFSDIISLFQVKHDTQAVQLKPFGVIIFLTLALAIFDLGKTILEEEVLMQKDILRHSSTRRTITRFIAAILIAVSIEALMLMFKGALSDGVETPQGVWMMLTAVGLLLSLGLYVYLGARAEAILLRQRR